GQAQAGHVLGDRLEQPARAAGDQLGDVAGKAAVVHRLGEVVGRAGGAEVQSELQVDHEHLTKGGLMGQGAVVAEHPQAPQQDAVAVHGGGSPGPVAASRASVMRTTRAMVRTAWTRTIRAPRSTTQVTVAAVPSSRWSTPSPRARPMKPLRLVPTSRGWPSRVRRGSEPSRA